MSDNTQRQASIERNTNETQISVAVNLDGTGKLNCDTGLPFLDHMLDQIARHGLIDIEVKAVGDLHGEDEEYYVRSEPGNVLPEFPVR